MPSEADAHAAIERATEIARVLEAAGISSPDRGDRNRIRVKVAKKDLSIRVVYIPSLWTSYTSMSPLLRAASLLKARGYRYEKDGQFALLILPR